MSRDLTVNWELKPYSDGSGYEYAVRIEEVRGEAKIILGGASGGNYYINVEDWPMVRDAISDILFFAERSRPKPAAAKDAAQ